MIRRDLASIAVALAGIAAPAVVSAAGALQRLDDTAKVAFPGQSPDTRAPQVAGTVIQFFIGILGTFFLVLMVYGGYLWMNARGNEQQVEKAKNILTQAVIGLIIILAAYSIASFVVRNLATATGLR